MPVTPATFIDWVTQDESVGPCRGSTKCVITCDKTSMNLSLTAKFGPGFACGLNEHWCLESALTGVRQIWGSSAQDYWAVGTNGLLWHHPASGPTIHSDPATHGITLRGIWGKNNNDIWAVGEGGKMLHYTKDTKDTIGSWQNDTATQAKFNPAGLPLYAVSGANEVVWAVGIDGLTLKHDDTGWHSITIDTHPRLYAVWAKPNGGAVAVGENGGAWEITSDATTWSKITIQGAPVNDFYAVWGTSDNKKTTIWIAGQGSTAYRLECLPTAPCQDMVVPVRAMCQTKNIQTLWGDSRGKVWAAGDKGMLCGIDGTMTENEPVGLLWQQLTVWSLWADPQNGGNASNLRAGNNAGILRRNY